MFVYFIIALFYGLPVAALIGFAVSLTLYIVAKVKNKRAPGTYSADAIRIRGICSVVFGAIFGTLVVVFVGILLLIYAAVAYM